MSAQAERLLDSGDQLGESPLWDEREGVLWWVDIHGRRLHRYDGRLRTFPMPEPIGSIALRADGGLLGALQTGIHLVDPRRELLIWFARPEEHRADHRFNDGRCDRAGRFWVGTMRDPEATPTGALYRLSPEGRCVRMRKGLHIPNGLAWSPDGSTMYLADSPLKTIWAYDYDNASGTMRNERVFARTELGVPDGSCVDADGCLWNAEHGASRVVRYTPEGRVDRIVMLPVPKVTACCFGAAGFDTLFMTTADRAGVFAIRPGPRGLPEPRFAS